MTEIKRGEVGARQDVPPVETKPPGAGDQDYRPSTAPQATGWVGWIVFAGVMMVLVGLFQVIDGLVALFRSGFYAVGPNGLVINIDFTVWGWIHFGLGVLLLAAGIGVFTGQTWARVLGITLAVLSALVNLAFIAAFPLWSVIMIALDVIVIYALAAHGREMRAVRD